MTSERYDQFSKSNADDEIWHKSVYFLGHRPEIRGPDAYKAWNKHFTGRRCPSSYFFYREYHQLFRRSFELASYLDTRDIPTLKFAMQQKIEQLTVPTDPDISRKLQNIVEHCPEQSAAELANRLLGIINRKQSR